MILIDEIIVSNDVLEQYFVCNLSACKGACCWEGDYGAPLEKKEMEIIENQIDQILEYLDERAVNQIQKKGWSDQFGERKFTGTQLMDDGACVFLFYDKGYAKCAFEKAYEDGISTFKKPISCHLYPIRVEKNAITNFEALNYDEWEICSAACSKGAKEKVPLYQFAKDAIIRKYGQSFYDELDKIAKDLSTNDFD